MSATTAESLARVTAMKQFEIAVATRKEEIDRLWSRSTVFWVISAAALTAYGALWATQDTKYAAERELLLQLVSAFGFNASLAWLAVNQGSKQWQTAWEMVVLGAERNAGCSVFLISGKLRMEGKPTKFSVSKLLVAVSTMFSLFWLVLMLGLGSWLYARPVPPIGPVQAIALAMAVAMLFWARSRHPIDDNEVNRIADLLRSV